jgi:hypothetical protein
MDFAAAGRTKAQDRDRGITVNPSRQDNGPFPGPVPDEWKQKADAFFEGKMSAAEQAAFEREMLADPARALAVYHEMGIGPMAHEALQALRIRHLESHARISDRSITKHVPWWGRTRSRLVVITLAVAVFILVISVSRIGDMSPDPPSGTPEVTAGFRTLGPAGSVQALPAQFSWTAHPTGTQYRIEIYDDTQIFHATITNDSVLIVNLDDLAARGLRSGFWRVVPLDEHGAELPATVPVSIELSVP